MVPSLSAQNVNKNRVGIQTPEDQFSLMMDLFALGLVEVDD